MSMDESSYWGMVWKTKRVEKENNKLYELIEEVIENDMNRDVLKMKLKIFREEVEDQEHLRMKRKLARLIKS
jgi:hypothetical protein